MDDKLKQVIQDYKYKDISLDEMYKKLLPHSGTYGIFPQHAKNSISDVLLDYKWKGKPFKDTIESIDKILWQTDSKKENTSDYYREHLLEKAIQDLKDFIAKQGNNP